MSWILSRSLCACDNHIGLCEICLTEAIENKNDSSIVNYAYVPMPAKLFASDI